MKYTISGWMYTLVLEFYYIPTYAMSQVVWKNKVRSRLTDDVFDLICQGIVFCKR